MARLDSSVFPALNESVVSKLHSQSIYTAYDFLQQKCNELMKKTGLTFKEVENIRGFFSTKFGGEVEHTLSFQERELKRKIPTGIPNLDALLGGGLCCGTIYEICGSSSVGKSQLCHWLSMLATSNDTAEVHYIDASRNFCSSRIQMILDSRHCDDNAMIGHVMSSIKVYQICKIHELISVFHSLANVSDENQNARKLIIVDSLSVLCRIVPNAELNPLLSNFASMCRYIVNHFEAVILIVNTVITQQVGTFLAEQKADNNFVLKIRPSLGDYWLTVPKVRLLMTQEENGQRKISVWKSQTLELANSCFVHIKDEGIFQS